MFVRVKEVIFFKTKLEKPNDFNGAKVNSPSITVVNMSRLIFEPTSLELIEIIGKFLTQPGSYWIRVKNALIYKSRKNPCMKHLNIVNLLRWLIFELKKIKIFQILKKTGKKHEKR